MRYLPVDSGYTDEAIFKRGKIVARAKCCDCGLVHDYTFWLLRTGRRFGLRRKIVRNARATAASRRKK